MNTRTLLFLSLLLLIPTAHAAPPKAAIASAHPLATEAGMVTLESGGNAFDAAVAVSAALAVVEPYGSGMGGGGFWLLHRAADGRAVMVDGRETAPAAAHRDMYLDELGEVIPRASLDGPLAAGIPGQPAALVHIAERYGRLPLARSLAPAIRLAREGFAVDGEFHRYAGYRLEALRASPDAARIFLRGGEVPAEGTRLRQPELAETLQAMADRGRAGFYQGETARRLVEGVRAAGGIWTAEDLRNYRVVEREPVRGEYRGMRLVSAAPPSSGGVALVEMLNILAGFDLAAVDDATRAHLLVEAMRRAYRDRAEYLGDADFVAVPLARLTSSDYAAGLRAGIRRDRATPSDALPGRTDGAGNGTDTSHFSILDREGNRVAATLSINYLFGSGFVAPGTGVLLNDEMDDFAIKPGQPNAYGLVGAEANAVAPGKRPLSSMSPTFLELGDRVAVLGTPGGSRIITMVLQAALAFHEGGGAEAMVNAPRLHHQYLPDTVQLEPGMLDGASRERLREMGHELDPKERGWGNMQAVVWERKTGVVEAASDPRAIGAASTR